MDRNITYCFWGRRAAGHQLHLVMPAKGKEMTSVGRWISILMWLYWERHNGRWKLTGYQAKKRENRSIQTRITLTSTFSWIKPGSSSQITLHYHGASVKYKSSPQRWSNSARHTELLVPSVRPLKCATGLRPGPGEEVLFDHPSQQRWQAASVCWCLATGRS